MRNVLIALDDPALRDQVRTAVMSFRELRPVNVDRDEVLRVVQDPAAAEALIVDYHRERSGMDPLLEEVRRTNGSIALIAVGHRPDREHFNQAKVDLDVFSFVPLPLDPFDLARRLHRLNDALAAPR